jgi:hypothetical protein
MRVFVRVCVRMRVFVYVCEYTDVFILLSFFACANVSLITLYSMVFVL